MAADDVASVYAGPPAHLPGFEALRPAYYHAIDLPNGASAPGLWDIRGRVDDYLGRFDFSGKRVLEIGPASGFLTMEMERRGADVVALDLPDCSHWDVVPFPDMVDVSTKALSGLMSLHATWWYTHKVFRLTARVAYADAYDIPAALGRFDVAVLAAVLLHTASPHRIIEQCARVADTIIVTDLYYPDIDPCGPILRLHPTTENKDWGLWWHITPAFITRFFAVLGFTPQEPTYSRQRDVVQDKYAEYFTIIASRST